MEPDPKQLRQAALDFALKAYGQMKHNRSYALTPQGKVGYAALTRAREWRRFPLVVHSHARSMQ